MKLIGSYVNGNYTVHIFEDGTKIRFNKLDNLTPDYPESMDLKICNRCDKGCPQCHECSTKDGVLGDLNAPFLSTIHPYTELAIGGGNPLEHPDLESFLERMKEQKVICNMTVHYDHFIAKVDLLRDYQKRGLIHGLGVSIPEYAEYTAAFEKVDNVVLHVIAGIVSEDTLLEFGKRGMKLLILGYKEYGRGSKYKELHSEIPANIEMLSFHLMSLGEYYDVISFDNLAIRQLNVREQVGEDVWNESYMGDDGEFTMYADLCTNSFALSSTSPRQENVYNNIDDMFNHVRRLEAEKDTEHE